MPAERAMTNSYLRLSEISVAIAANNPMKGTTCSISVGMRSALISSAMWRE